MSTNAVQISTQQTDVYDYMHETIKLSDLAETTRYRYGREVDALHAAGVHPLDLRSVQRHLSELPSSRASFLSAVLKRHYKAGILDAKSSSTPDTVNQVRATVDRLEALLETIKPKRHTTKRKAIWLSDHDLGRLLAAPRGRFAKRDRVAMALLLQTGMRRDEASRATFGDIHQQGDVWHVHIVGKGSKARSVPIPAKLVDMLKRWQRATGAGDDDQILAKSQPGGGWVPGLSPDQLMQIVRRHGKAIGKADLAPHDLRRTCAQRWRREGVDIVTISRWLGHASVATTQRYLGDEGDNGNIPELPIDWNF